MYKLNQIISGGKLWKDVPIGSETYTVEEGCKVVVGGVVSSPVSRIVRLGRQVLVQTMSGTKLSFLEYPDPDPFA